MSFASQFLGGGVSPYRGWKMAIFTTNSITFPKAGYVRLAMQGSGGSGATVASASNGVAATGGNSGPWGVKSFRVAANDALVVNIGAGGAQPTGGVATAGNQGGVSTAVLNGSTILTAQGGEGGLFRTSAGTIDAPVPSATVTGGDFWVPGIRAGSATCSGSVQALSAGAASDVLRCGLGRSASVNAVGVFSGGCVGSDGGFSSIPYIAFEDFGIVPSSPGSRSPGQGGVQASSWQAGPFAGGANCPQSSQVAMAHGGYGGGGGAGYSQSFTGIGGGAYAYLIYEPVE